MSWKIFMMLCVSVFGICFPQNIIGCGADMDPYDYYSSFFQNDIANARAYQPFYYTGYNFLYDDQEPVSQEDVLAKEWASYCGSTVNEKAAKEFVMKYAYKDLATLYNNIDKSKPLSIPDSVKLNPMTTWFINQKDLEALGYLMYAKQVEPTVNSSYNYWDAAPKDSLKMDKLLKNGQQLYAAAKTDFFKLKYGYQIVRLAHYNDHSADAIKYYDEYIVPNKYTSVLQPMSLALKAGALFRTGKGEEAAYLFSKVFAQTDVKKVSNYLGFNWSVIAEAGKEKYLVLCKDDKEKADMMALFAFGSSGKALDTLKELVSYNPDQKALPTLVAREINKLEEALLTPKMQIENGGKAFYYSWKDVNGDSALVVQNTYAGKVADFLISMANKNKSKAGFYHLAAAYTQYMRRNLTVAKEELEKANTFTLTDKEKDQYALTKLLVIINEQQSISPEFEQDLLPSIKWLRDKALHAKAIDAIGYPYNQWQIFYRNFFSDVLSKKYHAQKDFYKEALCVGAAENFTMEGSVNNFESQGTDFMHDNLSSKDVELLYTLMTKAVPTAFEEYLLKNSTIKKRDVVDFAGTAYLRNYDYEKAIQWFAKGSPAKEDVIKKNPFIDLLYDQEEQLPYEKITTTKQAFAKEMLRLQKIAQTDKINAARYYYKMALGMYNITYYGHAWELVNYYRSGSDGYFIPKDATDFQKEYYGAYSTDQMFKKAMDASPDKNFKARCLFMMAKCSQKKVQQPQYDQYPNYDDYEAAGKNYFPRFKDNIHFPQLVKEYSGTAFYKEALSSCSYLAEFVKKN